QRASHGVDETASARFPPDGAMRWSYADGDSGDDAMARAGAGTGAPTSAGEDHHEPRPHGGRPWGSYRGNPRRRRRSDRTGEGASGPTTGEPVTSTTRRVPGRGAQALAEAAHPGPGPGPAH